MPPNVKSGDKIGEYVVDDVISRGGMAWIIRVKDRASRKYALKLSRALGSHRENEMAIRRETDVLEKLEHKRVVKLVEIQGIKGKSRKYYHARAHKLPGKPWYYVMEYLEGGTLKDHLKRVGALTLGEATNIAANVALGLYHLHGHGYSHNDLKADNVLFRYPLMEGAKFDPVLIDFGITASIDEPQTRAGSLYIMPPEVLMLAKGLLPEAARDEMSAATVDIWSLGVMVYQMLTSKLPFPSLRDETVTQQIIDNKPKRISEVNKEGNRG